MTATYGSRRAGGGRHERAERDGDIIRAIERSKREPRRSEGDLWKPSSGGETGFADVMSGGETSAEGRLRMREEACAGPKPRNERIAIMQNGAA